MRRTRLFLLVLAMLLLAACQATLASVPAPTATPVPRAGQPIKGTAGTVYRLMEGGAIRHIQDWATFLAWGFSPGAIRQLPDSELTTYRLAAPLTRFVTGDDDPALYALFNGRRYPLAAPPEGLPGFPLRVSHVPDGVLAGLPLAESEYPAPAPWPDGRPTISAAVWFGDALWIADESGAVRRFDPANGQFGAVAVPDGHVTAFAVRGDSLYAGMSTGAVRLLNPSDSLPLLDGPGWISALTVDSQSRLLAADRSHYDLGTGRYQDGRGLLTADGSGLSALLPDDAARRITAMAVRDGVLWAGTDYSGLLRCDDAGQPCQALTTLNSAIPDNAVRDVEVGPDGALWIAYPGGVARLEGEDFHTVLVGDGISPTGMASLALQPDGTVWAAGEYVVARVDGTGEKAEYTAFDHPFFLDRFVSVVLDGHGQPWFVGQKRLLTFDGAAWTTYAYDEGGAISFTPGEPPLDPVRAFPDPLTEHAAWVRAWPRPDEDNGLCLHYVQSPTGDAFETRQQIARLERLGLKWTLVNYVGRAQLLQLAELFAPTGITVIWRPYVSPAYAYPYWADDVRFLRSLGLPPYIQVYNEPNLAQEWSESPPAEAQAVYLSNLVPAVRAVYDAGGFVGLQHIDRDWLRASLQMLKEAGLSDTFDRLFFVPHPYGFNHPPDYAADEYGVLGFRAYAEVFEEEIGFTPVMIAGEGGWRPGEAQDASYPAVSDALHRDYHLAVFDWFRTGTLSDGAPLPDYLFAFCPWLLSDLYDPAGWYDSGTGDRTLTIRAVEALPDFVRRFGP